MIGKRYEYKAMSRCEQQLWWFRCLHDLTLQQIQSYFPSKEISILDAGCGTGGMLSYLQNNGYHNLRGFDISTDAIEYAAQKTGLAVQHIDLKDTGMEYPFESFDVVISNDTLCYFSDSQSGAILAKLIKLVKKGGLVIFNLPALKAFGGEHDIAVGIKERYTVKKIKNFAPENGLISKIIFWPFLLSPLLFVARFFQRLRIEYGREKEAQSDVKLIPAPVNAFFYFITKQENILFKKKPWGSSILTVIQKV